MKSLCSMWFLLLGALCFGSGTQCFARSLPETVYVYTLGTTAQNIMMSSLAGIANRNTAGEVLLSPQADRLPAPLFWLRQLKEEAPSVRYQFKSDPEFFLEHYRQHLKGYVFYDREENPHSINIATSIAGVTDALMVDRSTRHYARRAGLSLIADATTTDYPKAYSTYQGKFDRTRLFYQRPRFNEMLRDFCIMNRGFMFYADPTELLPYAKEQEAHGKIYGWGPSEHAFFRDASILGQGIVPSDWSWSSSTTAQWRVPLVKQSFHTSFQVPTQAGKHYVAFVMSDGDNVQVLTRGWATDRRWFGSPHRGNFTMNWDLTGSLAEVNPVAFNYYYRKAKMGAQFDSFVSAGGGSMIFPSRYPDKRRLAAMIEADMQLADHRTVSILDDSYDLPSLKPILESETVLGMMFKTYDRFYKGRNGSLDWHQGKPILSVKYSLWDGADDARFIAQALNQSPHRDALSDSNSFSIVNVHPWSTRGPDGRGEGDPMSNLDQLVRWLDKDKVNVVSLEEIMIHLRKNFGSSPGGKPVLP